MTRSDGCRPPILRVEIGQAGRQAGQAAVALIGARRHVDRGGQRLGEALKAGIVASGLGDFVEFALGLLDVVQRRRIDRRVVGEIDHVLADRDQIAADREVVDGAAIVLGIDDRGRFGGEPRQILIDRQAGDVEIARQERLQRHRGRELVGADQSAGELENALMDRLEEMLRLEEVGDPVERLVVDQDGAEQRLFGLDIVRCACGMPAPRARLLACGRIRMLAWSRSRGFAAVADLRSAPEVGVFVDTQHRGSLNDSGTSVVRFTPSRCDATTHASRR